MHVMTLVAAAIDRENDCIYLAADSGLGGQWDEGQRSTWQTDDKLRRHVSLPFGIGITGMPHLWAIEARKAICEDDWRPRWPDIMGEMSERLSKANAWQRNLLAFDVKPGDNTLASFLIAGFFPEPELVELSWEGQVVPHTADGFAIVGSGGTYARIAWEAVGRIPSVPLSERFRIAVGVAVGASKARGCDFPVYVETITREHGVSTEVLSH